MLAATSWLAGLALTNLRDTTHSLVGRFHEIEGVRQEVAVVIAASGTFPASTRKPRATMRFMTHALQLLLLLGVANGAPILAWRICGRRGNRSIDGGRSLADGRPLFGHSKTWRGIVAACVLTPLAAIVIGIPATIGLLIAVGAMTGDLLSSFTKRRLNRPVSSMAPGLDQIPEALLPLLLVKSVFNLTLTQIVILVVAFIIAELLLSRVLYHFGLRKRPY